MGLVGEVRGRLDERHQGVKTQGRENKEDFPHCFKRLSFEETLLNAIFMHIAVWEEFCTLLHKGDLIFLNTCS